MKRLFSIFIIVSIVNQLSAQSTMFNNVYEGNTPGLRNILEVGDNFLGLGFEYNNYSKTEILILCFNESGDILWEKTYGDSIFDYYHGTRNSFIENNDGGYSLAGARDNTTNDTTACMLTKFNNQFDTLWTKLYFNNLDFTAFYNHIQTSDGGYALVGSNNEDDPDGDVLLVKTDSDGNMEWYKKYGTSNRDIGTCIVTTEDAGYLIGGNTAAYGNKDGYLIKTDSQGNLEWTKHYGNPLYPDGTIYTIVRTEHDEYVIALSSYVTSPISEPFYNRRYSIIKLDSEFNEVWNNIYGVNAEYSGLGSIAIVENGDIMASITDDHISGLMRISSDGDSISTHYYTPEGSVGENALLAIRKTSDNGFIMAGVAYEPQVMWLVKTDSCGCVTEGCDCGGSSVQHVLANKEIKIYPNPTSDILHFNLPERAQNINIEIYDHLGRLIITNKLLDWENTIDVIELKTGNYFMRIKSNSDIWTKWFVKE